MPEKPTSKKKWSELDLENNRHFFRLLADRAEKFGVAASSAWAELAKFLFATNTGASAGLFLLIKPPESQRGYLLPFYLFATGTAAVGIAYFLHAIWMKFISDGWTEDFNRLGHDEITFGELDAGNKKRLHSTLGKLSSVFLVVSFLCLISGALASVRNFVGK